MKKTSGTFGHSDIKIPGRLSCHHISGLDTKFSIDDQKTSISTRARSGRVSSHSIHSIFCLPAGLKRICPTAPVTLFFLLLPCVSEKMFYFNEEASLLKLPFRV
jgi:hypothetical protein